VVRSCAGITHAQKLFLSGNLKNRARWQNRMESMASQHGGVAQGGIRAHLLSVLLDS
jgi:hypothetical protein